jgi:hypothetical protein
MTNKNYAHITFVLDSSGSMGTIKKDTIGGYNEFLRQQKFLTGKLTYTHVEFSSGNPEHRKNERVTRHLITYLPAKCPPLWAIGNNAPPVAVPFIGQISCNTTTNIVIGTSAMVPLLPANNLWIPPVQQWTGGRSTNQYATVENCIDISKAVELTENTYLPSGGTPLLDSIGRAIFETGEVLLALPEDERPDRVLFVILTDGEENVSQEYTKEDIKAIQQHQETKYAWDFMFLGANMDAIAVGGSYGFNSLRTANFCASSAGIGGTFSTLTEKVSTYRCATSKVDATASLNLTSADRTKCMGGDTTTGSGSVS